MDTAQGPRLSVIIVNWNAGDELRACLASLYTHSPASPWEVIVVDNASHDGSASAAADAHPDLRLIANPTNRGLAAGNNQGILAARGDLLLICNPDVEFHPGAVDALVAAMSRHPKAAFIVPRLTHTDGSPQASAGDLPSITEAIRGRRASRHADATSGFWWDGWAHDEERQIGRGAECAYLVRREAVVEVGLQDERFALEWEGIDWAARVADAGWEVWFTPDAVVVHHGGRSIRQVQPRWVFRSHLGMYRYFAKRRPILRLVLAPIIALRGALKMAELVKTGDVYTSGLRG